LRKKVEENQPFLFVANQKLLEEVGMIQHKDRRVDLVEDEECSCVDV
jgi:ATP-dependent helicase HrpA